LRIPKEVLRRRLRNFQERLNKEQIDAIMLRTLSSFKYFTGIKWLRPALLIPAEGEPIAFVVKGEEELFREKSSVKEVETFVEVSELMAKVSGIIRNQGYRIVGLEYGTERDAYILFYEMFKRLNPSVKIVDVSKIISKMRLIKDKYELEAIRKASEVASKVIGKLIKIIEPGLSETEIAAEAYRELYKLDSEEPHVYVNVGPHPRVHAEPFKDIVVKEGVLVSVTIGADYNGYYANVARTIFVGRLTPLAKRVLECVKEVYREALRMMKVGVKFMDVIRGLDRIYAKYGLTDHRVIGYVHGVGLQVEETPITTIVPAHRMMGIEPYMALALVHSPIMVEGLGQAKEEDTFIVSEDGYLNKITHVN